jgi:ribonuclease HI
LYAVILTRRKLRHYFESHPVTVVSSFPLGEIIQCRETSGRIAKWATEIMGETISFAPRKAIKSQVLADFVAEWVDTQLPAAPIQPELWTMFFNGSLMKTGAGAGLLFISPLGKHLRYVLRLHFPASNNVAEYEALVNGLRIAIELGVQRLDARGDSQLVIDQVMKSSPCRDPKMEAYCDEVRRLEGKFYGLELNHVARRYNETADELAKIASGWTTIPPDVFSRDLHQPSVKTDDTPEPEKVSALPEAPSAQPATPSAQPEAPSAPEGEALRVEEEWNGVPPNRDWQTPYLQYLHRGELPLDQAEARRLARRAKSFVLLGDGKELYHRSPSGILQRCISIAEGQELLQEIDSGVAVITQRLEPLLKTLSDKASTGRPRCPTPLELSAPAKGVNSMQGRRTYPLRLCKQYPSPGRLLCGVWTSSAPCRRHPGATRTCWSPSTNSLSGSRSDP